MEVCLHFLEVFVILSFFRCVLLGFLVFFRKAVHKKNFSCAFVALCQKGVRISVVNINMHIESTILAPCI